jgi:hypothetical protein
VFLGELFRGNPDGRAEIGLPRHQAHILHRAMAKYVELRRHTDADGNVLTPEGCGRRSRSDCALRAATTCSSRPARSGRLRRSPASLRDSERRCRREWWSSPDCAPAPRTAGERPIRRPGAAHSRRSARRTPSSSRKTPPRSRPRCVASLTYCPKAVALVVGHSPTNEAAVLGLAGEIVDPISKGGGVLVVEQDGAVRVERLD